MKIVEKKEDEDVVRGRPRPRFCADSMGRTRTHPQTKMMPTNGRRNFAAFAGQ